MSKLPFEDAFKNKMSDLPPGDENASWQKMKELLDEKEKRKPFAWLNIYTICTGILIIAAFCIWINSSHYNKQKEITATEKNTKSETAIKNNKEITRQLSPGEQTNKVNNTAIQNNKTGIELNKNSTPVNEIKSGKTSSSNSNQTSKIFYNHHSIQKNQTTNKKNDELNNKQLTTLKKDSINVNTENVNQKGFNKLQDSNAIDKNKSITSALKPSVAKLDSAKTATAINNLNEFYKADTSSNKKQTKILFKPKKQFFVEAGIQLKQQIPLGEKIIAYNYNGNKNLVADYIPSVFIQFEKNKQWFWQGEFSYATPHLIKQFSYSHQTKVDYTASTVTVTTANLQKTYYNELPLSFNYYVQPRWSIGSGIIYGWFHGAVAEQETITNDIKAGTLITAKQIMPFKNFTDSFLYKNQASLLVQTGYSFNKWSFTLRYEKGIQPYIKYTLPNGDIKNKENSLLEFQIGYRFIKSPDFGLRNKHCLF